VSPKVWRASCGDASPILARSTSRRLTGRVAETGVRFSICQKFRRAGCRFAYSLAV